MAQITLNSSGVASSGSLLLQTNGTTTQATVDTSGNMGLGVTPSAWGSTSRALQMQSGMSLFSNTSGLGGVGNNVYSIPGTGDYYIANGYASRYYQYQGTHVWNTAASGTAGNAITFTQAMTLNASGSLLLNTTSSPTYGGAGSVLLNNATAVDLEFNISNTLTGYIYAQSTNFQVGSATSIPLIFLTGNSERARIDSSGNLLLNTTSTLGTTWFNVYGATSSKNGIGIQNSSDTGTIYSLFIRNASNTTIGSINNNGSTTSFTTTSDYRLKENIQPMTGALAKVSALKPCTYTWKESGFNSQGFIAHELQAVVPDAVVGVKDAVDEEGNPVYQGIDTSFLVATLTAALQELKAIVDAQAAEIAALKG